MSNDTAPATETQQQQASDRQVLVRLVALMLDRDLPTPASLVTRSYADNVQVRLPQGDQDAVHAWAAALGLGAPEVPTMSQISVSGPVPLLGGRYAIVYAYVTPREPEPPLAGDDAAGAAKILAAADQPWFDADAPRTSRWENEADRVEAEGLTEVVDDDGDTWVLLDDGVTWYCSAKLAARSWDRLLQIGPLTEVVAPAQGGAR